MANVFRFEICADDLEGAARFYSEVFGWRIEKDESSDYWSIATDNQGAAGIGGGLVSRFDEWNPTIITFQIPSVDTFAKKITEAGGMVLAPKMPIARTGYVQYCQDPEGNTFGIIELDESAE